MIIQSKNPATGEVVRTFQADDDARVEEKISRAHSSFLRHRRSSFADRSRRMSAVAGILERDSRRYAEIITLEMGKPISASIAEVKKCATACRFYAENAERILADVKVSTEASENLIRHQPLGVILAVMPWNFPLWQVFRFAAPALMAGNTGLLKHSSNVPQCALAIEEIFRSGGFEKDEFQALLIPADRVAGLLEDDRIAAATLTGSEPAGASIAEAAGRNIKKVVLELGGSDPFIVMPSANVDEAADIAVKARTINAGQSCIAAKRFLIHQDIVETFLQKFVDGMKGLVLGDPMDERTEVGPLATEKILEDVAAQVEESVASGARVLCGGKRIATTGNFYAPTVLIDAPRQAPARCDEIFGPVASVTTVHSIEEAIEIANETKFGLGSSVWTNNDAERERFINEIEAGQVFVNAMVASDARLPFGGIKRSGFGRELGELGILEFVNAKTVSIARR